MLHSSLWKFDLTLDKKWLGLISLAMFPGMLMSAVTQNTMWFASAFLAVNSILPLSNTFSSRLFAVLYSMILCALAYFTHYLINSQNYEILLIFFGLLAILCGILDNGDKRFRYIVAGLVIASIYGGEQLIQRSISTTQALWVLLLAIFSVVLVILAIKIEKIVIRPQVIGIHHNQFIFNFKYLLPLITSIVVWHKFNIAEPQWLLWSSLSVVYTNSDALLLKFQQRAFGVVAGVILGLIISTILPINAMVNYVCFTLTLLSLGMFKHYFPSYFLRCLCAVVYAGNNSTLIALERFENVILGGIIGVLCTYLLISLHKLQHKHNSHT